MWEFFKVLGIGLITLLAYIIIKPLKPKLAVFITLAGVTIILFSCIDGLMSVVETMTQFVQKTGINTQLFACVLKIIGIGYVTEFSSSLCTTAGNSTIADMISLAGKITIFLLSMPILSSLINLIIEILP
ncbi:MAG: stage III sporulation protein AD [Clostridia bacterium]|nr:stage III sporulation protein AD [Clostridia bacterium]